MAQPTRCAHTPMCGTRQATQAYAYRSSTRLSSVALSLRDPAAIGYKKMAAKQPRRGTCRPLLQISLHGAASAGTEVGVGLQRDQPYPVYRPARRYLDSEIRYAVRVVVVERLPHDDEGRRIEPQRLLDNGTGTHELRQEVSRVGWVGFRPAGGSGDYSPNATRREFASDNRR